MLGPPATCKYTSRPGRRRLAVAKTVARQYFHRSQTNLVRGQQRRHSDERLALALPLRLHSAAAAAKSGAERQRKTTPKHETNAG